MPRLAGLYIAVVAFLAVVLAIATLPDLPWSSPDMVDLAIFVVAAAAAQVSLVFMPRVPGVFFTIGTAVYISIAILFGPGAVVWSALISSAAANLALRRPWSRVIFNPSQLALAYGAAAFAYRQIWRGDPLVNLWPATGAVMALALAYFLVNTGLVFLVLSLVDRMPFLRLWRTRTRFIITHDVVMVAVGLVFVVLYSYNHWTIPLIAPLVLVLYRSMAAVGNMELQTKRALQTLARVIDERDANTFAHSERVAEYVAWICAELRLPSDEVGMIVYCARLHDLGKVGVPDALLLKPDKLTAEEQAQFRRHADLGADIIAEFPIFREGAQIVRHDHERFDGDGYPQGLKGEAIPLGSRIIAVADAYEAMTSDRPYRKGMPPAIAVERLSEASGSQFDPSVVRAFVTALDKRRANAEPLRAANPPNTSPLVMRRDEDVLATRAQPAKA